LCVEAETGFPGELAKLLAAEGYTIDSCADGLEAQYRATADSYDMIILDTALPSKSGLEACRYLRKNVVRAPILILGAES
jgi:two-component system OmpR family response regulator